MVCDQGRNKGDSIFGWGMIFSRSKTFNILDLRGKSPTIIPPLEGNPDVLVPKIRAKTKVTNYEAKSY